MYISIYIHGAPIVGYAVTLLLTHPLYIYIYMYIYFVIVVALPQPQTTVNEALFYIKWVSFTFERLTDAT